MPAPFMGLTPGKFEWISRGKGTWCPCALLSPRQRRKKDRHNGEPRDEPGRLPGSYPKRGEKSVSVKNVESTFSTNLPFSSDFAFTLFHSGSS